MYVCSYVRIRMTFRNGLHLFFPFIIIYHNLQGNYYKRISSLFIISRWTMFYNSVTGKICFLRSGNLLGTKIPYFTMYRNADFWFTVIYTCYIKWNHLKNYLYMTNQMFKNINMEKPCFWGLKEQNCIIIYYSSSVNLLK